MLLLLGGIARRKIRELTINVVLLKKKLTQRKKDAKAQS